LTGALEPSLFSVSGDDLRRGRRAGGQVAELFMQQQEKLYNDLRGDARTGMGFPLLEGSHCITVAICDRRCLDIIVKYFIMSNYFYKK
jgi:hypothetical protein